MPSSLKKIQGVELKKRIDEGTAVIIDVREPAEFQSEKIEGAKNRPLSALVKKVSGVPKEKPVYLLCRSGSRACQAAEKLGSLGYDNIWVVDGGMEACKQQGISVTIGSSKVWALDRQVRFAAGVLVLTGIFLSWVSSPIWIGLSTFVGAGLAFSGVTNTCGMGMMLAKMPWNQTQEACCSLKGK